MVELLVVIAIVDQPGSRRSGSQRHAGPEHVGIGSDFDGVDLLPRQLESVATYPLITQELLNRGHSPAVIRQIMGGNVMRVFRVAERVAERLTSTTP